MEITSATAASLGEKLAGLELSAEEGALLGALLAEGPEVSGFGHQPERPGFSFNFEEIKVNVLDPLPGPWKPSGDSYSKIEWT